MMLRLLFYRRVQCHITWIYYCQHNICHKTWEKSPLENNLLKMAILILEKIYFEKLLQEPYVMHVLICFIKSQSILHLSLFMCFFLVPVTFYHLASHSSTDKQFVKSTFEKKLEDLIQKLFLHPYKRTRKKFMIING